MKNAHNAQTPEEFNTQLSVVYQNFWKWFILHEKTFFDTVKNKNRIDELFLDTLEIELLTIKQGIYFLTGMYEDDRAELILTPEGKIENIVFIEELVHHAPDLPNWKFTALKQKIPVDYLQIKMEGLFFNQETMAFYAIENSDYPDQIEIVLTHTDYVEDNKQIISNGALTFVDNLLGELNSVTLIDRFQIVNTSKAEAALIPIAKLPDYLNWREKEFIEKYQEETLLQLPETYTVFKANATDNSPYLGIINTSVLNWEAKASHPWILVFSFRYNGNNNQGLPEPNDYNVLNDMEDELIHYLTPEKGCLHIGRESHKNIREVFFACNEFRNCSKIAQFFSFLYGLKFEVSYEIFKDKYWQTFEKFQ